MNKGHLVLSRRVNETLYIGDDIKVTILAINGNQVKIGIIADKSVPIHRDNAIVTKPKTRSYP